MKNIIFLLTSLLITFSNYSYCQERQDEVREKLNFKIDAQSQILSQAIGWSLIENSDGKFWKQSDNSLGYNFLPGKKLDYAFNSLQFIKFTIEGKCFYALCVIKPIYPNQVAYYIFEENDYSAFPLLLDIPTIENLPIFSVKWCKFGNTVDGNYYPDVDLKDKEMIRYLLLGKEPGSLFRNNCEGYYAMNISSLVIKGDSIIRFNILADVRTMNGSKVTLPVENSYFEVKKQDFRRLIKYSPFITRETKIKQKQSDQNEVIRNYDRYFDSINKQGIPYNLLSESSYSLKSREVLISNYFDYSILIEDSITYEKQFNIIVGSQGKVISSPYELKLFKNITFRPATIEVEYLPGKKKEYAVNSAIPVRFVKDKNGGVKKSEYFSLIIKKSKNGIEILNQCNFSKELIDDVKPKINLEKEFSQYDNGKYYYIIGKHHIEYTINLWDDSRHSDGDGRNKGAGIFYKIIYVKGIEKFDASKAAANGCK